MSHLHDADQPQPSNGQPKLVEKMLIFNCPEDFDPAIFVICAMNKEGKTFSNAPLHRPNIALHLATKILDFCSQQAVMWIQGKQAEESPIVLAKGALPPFPGPAGQS